MIKFDLSILQDELRKALVNEELGVEKMNEFYLHESLAKHYLEGVLRATEEALRARLYDSKPCAELELERTPGEAAVSG